MKNISHIKNLSIASISDIHLGHNRNTADEIIKNLDSAFPDNSETAELDLIFIAGDVFDTLLYLSSEYAGNIKAWIARLLRIAKKYDIVIRVLEGTPSHDRKQSNLFTLINTIADIGTDVKHVTELSIEHLDKFNLDILYIPDEWTDSPEKTYEQVIDLMHGKNINKVDFTVMHGAFTYQMHPAAKSPSHNEEQYLSITKEYIFIGHIHTHSVYKRILAQGSFDRIAHGEEEPKGHLRIKYDSDGNRRIKFIENKNAKVFRTINCSGLDVEQTIEKVKEIVSILPMTSFVRIEAERKNPIFSTFEVLIRLFPLITWSKLPRDEDEEENVNVVQDEEDVFIPITITKDNIVPLLMARIIKQGTSEIISKRCESLLLDVV